MKVKIVNSEPAEVIDPFITQLAACIDNSKRVLVITGAGISCNGGIPVSLLYEMTLIYNH
jgi:NAD-dependent histone deacetylase SIR2